MWEGVDLKVGDVVTRVNGFKIERDYEANAAFKSLAVASEIRVSLIREGTPTEIRFAIEE
jgi:type II secretory pathway component PulC